MLWPINRRSGQRRAGYVIRMSDESREIRMSLLEQIIQDVETGDSASVKENVRVALRQNIPPEDILYLGLIKGMDIVGKKFKENEIFIPEVLIATRAMKSGMEMIRPYMSEEKRNPEGKIVIGTVKGDLHDIGKNIVIMTLESEGYQIIDLGVDVSKENFLETVKKEHPDVLGMSSLLTTTMPYMREVIEAIDQARLREKMKVIIGGAPITQIYADEIKADGYAPDAVSAIGLLQTLSIPK